MKGLFPIDGSGLYSTFEYVLSILYDRRAVLFDAADISRSVVHVAHLFGHGELVPFSSYDILYVMSIPTLSTIFCVLF